MGMHNRDEIVNYFAWQADLFAGHARGTIIDHGAGTGGLSSALLAAHLGQVVAVEPDPQLVAVLHAKFDGVTGVSISPGTLDDYLVAHGPASVACLQVMYELLRPGGAVALYLPARPELFGSLDRAVGHHRRYTKPEITKKLQRAGFRIERVQYRNLVSVIPWLITGRLMKLDKLGDGSLKLFDKFVFPISRWLEDRVPPRYGLNLVAIALK
jgi:SAM-dependent methyltransferase